MEELVTGDIWGKVNNHLTKHQKKIACIAYVTSDKLNLSEFDTLICDASLFAIKFGETSAKVLETYFKMGIKVLSNQQLHSKILLTETLLVVGSANLSKNSAEKLTETSIITDNDLLISQAKAFCHNLIEESKLLNEKDIQTLLKIQVVKQPSKPTKASKTRQREFGNRYWYTTAYLLEDKAYMKIKDKVEEDKAFISKTTKIENKDIELLRLSAKTKFSDEVKEGDQIIFKLNNANNTRSYVYPPSSILKKVSFGGFTHFYHDNRGLEENKISWTKFQDFLKTIILENNITSRTKIMSENDIKKIKPVWDK